MFCSPRLASVIQEDNFVCIFLCEIFILALSCLALMSAIWGFLDQGLFTTGFFTQACLYPHLWDFYSITVISCLNVSNMGFARPMVFINRFFLTQAHLSVVFAFMRECSAATASHRVVVSQRNTRSQLIVTRCTYMVEHRGNIGMNMVWT